MKIAEIREFSAQELKERVDAEVKRLDLMKINHSISPLDNPAQITQLRKDVAKMRTELRHRELNK
ncbi:MAG: 50S ribosomal protein L29 [Bacteroidales bacterium]|nr:50S ribosomal protein L29 [Bacteroidales bacterium]MDD4822664.1 50S ribosomal protein L29 [Bacteroidales bacterium]